MLLLLFIRYPDILLPLPWDTKPTCVDITVISPIQSKLPVTFTPGQAAASAEASKIGKHLSPCELVAGMRILSLGFCSSSRHTTNQLCPRQVSFYLGTAINFGFDGH